MADTGAPTIPPAARSAMFRMDLVGRADRYHFVTESEIDALRTFGLIAGICFGLFTFCGGLVAAFGTTLSTNHAAMTDRMLAIYVGLVMASGVLTVGAGMLALFTIRQSQTQLQRMKDA